ncbi:MAG: TcdA/TcdB pore-forming domain-containing protein [Bacteroidia bacterium]|nr:TcdA/TcdB pore-forming domain-containing protein [Bacteroidia bacterium]
MKGENYYILVRADNNPVLGIKNQKIGVVTASYTVDFSGAKEKVAELFSDSGSTNFLLFDNDGPFLTTRDGKANVAWAALKNQGKYLHMMFIPKDKISITPDAPFTTQPKQLPFTSYPEGTLVNSISEDVGWSQYLNLETSDKLYQKVVAPQEFITRNDETVINVQVDDDPVIKEGSQNFMNRFPGRSLWVKWDKEMEKFVYVQGDQSILFGTVDRIRVHGHGSPTTIGGFEARDLAKKLSEDLLIPRGISSVRRIRLKACELSEGYVKDFWDALSTLGIKTQGIKANSVSSYTTADGKSAVSVLTPSADVFVKNAKVKTIYAFPGPNDSSEPIIVKGDVLASDGKEFDIPGASSFFIRSQAILDNPALVAATYLLATEYINNMTDETWQAIVNGKTILQDPRKSVRFNFTSIASTEPAYLLMNGGKETNPHAYILQACPLFDRTGNPLQENHPSYIDIPAVPESVMDEEPFLFTSPMRGGSLVVTQHPSDPNLLRVYHDSRPNSAILYRDKGVIMAVEQNDYKFTEAQKDLLGEPTATVFMVYDDNQKQWKIIKQDNLFWDREFWGRGPDGKPTAADVKEFTPESFQSQGLHDRFFNELYTSQNALLDMVTTYKNRGYTLDDIQARQEAQKKGTSPTPAVWEKLTEDLKDAREDFYRKYLRQINAQLSQLDPNIADQATIYERFVKNKAQEQAKAQGETGILNNLTDKIDRFKQYNANEVVGGLNPAQQWERKKLELAKTNGTKSINEVAMNNAEITALLASLGAEGLVKSNQEKLKGGTRWMPLLETLEGKEGQREIQMMNVDKPEVLVKVPVNEESLWEFREFVNEKLGTFNRGYYIEDSDTLKLNNLSEVDPVDGLNAALTFQTLFSFFRAHEKENIDSPLSSDMKKALEAHVYLNLIQVGHGTLMDATKVVQLVRAAVSGEELVAGEGLSTFSKAFSRVAGEGLGTAFMAGNVVLDIYQLAHAEDTSEKILLGTQTAFDGASLVTGVAGISMGLLAEAGTSFALASTVLGGAGVILGGLAIGFTALAQAFNGVAAEAEQILGTFENMYDNWEKAVPAGGVSYDSTHDALSPLPGIVIQKIDLRSGITTFSSQKVYRTIDKTAAFPSIDYQNSFSVRKVWGFQDNATFQHKESKILILPAEPDSVFDYWYVILACAHNRIKSYKGYDKVKILNQKESFTFEFYYWPSEWVIRDLKQYYLDSTISIILDTTTHQLIVPNLDNVSQYKGHITYQIYGRGGEPVITLNSGVSIELYPSTDETKETTTWVLDATNLSTDSPQLSQNKLILDGISISIHDPQYAQILIIKKNGEVSEIENLSTQSPSEKITSEDASKYKLAGKSIEQYLADLAKAHKLLGKYVVVENYTIPGTQITTRAYYENKEDGSGKFLYTHTSDTDLTREAVLRAVDVKNIYFQNGNAVWLTDYDSLAPKEKYAFLFEQSSQLVEIQPRATGVTAIQEVVSSNRGNFFFSYYLQENTSLFTALRGDTVLTDKLKKSGKLAGTLLDEVKTILPAGSANNNPAFDNLTATLVQPVSDTFITVESVDASGNIQRIWYRTTDYQIIAFNFTDAAVNDVMLLNWQKIEGQEDEIFFFYSRQQQTLYRQTGPATGNNRATSKPATALPIAHLAKIVRDGNFMLAFTTDGLVFQIDTDGYKNLIGVNQTWLQNHPNWWNALPGLAEENPETRPTISLLGLTNADGKTLAAWFDLAYAQVVIVPEAHIDAQLTYLGIAEQVQGAWFWDTQSGKIYWQPISTFSKLQDAFGTGTQLTAGILEPSLSYLSDLYIQNARIAGGRLVVRTKEGLQLTVDDKGQANILSVDETWSNAHARTLLADMKTLADQYAHGEVIGLVKSQTDGSLVTTSWYHISTQKQITPPDIEAKGLQYLGGYPLTHTFYFVSPQNHNLYSYQNQELAVMIGFFQIHRFDDALFLSSAKGEKLENLPLLDGCNDLSFSGGLASDLFQLTINQDTWNHYQAFRISCNEYLSKTTAIYLPFVEASGLELLVIQDDLMLINTGQTSKTILLAGARLMSDPDSLVLHFKSVPGGADKSLSIGKIKDFLESNPQPGATLDTILSAPIVLVPISLSPAHLGKSDVTFPLPMTFYSNEVSFNYRGGKVMLSSTLDGKGQIYVDDMISLTITRPDGSRVSYSFDYSHGNCGRIIPEPPVDISTKFQVGINTVKIQLIDLYYNSQGSSPFYLVPE